MNKYFGNYIAYPKDIQNMIDNNDARYAYRWLKDDYLEIEAWLIMIWINRIHTDIDLIIYAMAIIQILHFHFSNFINILCKKSHWNLIMLVGTLWADAK